MTLRIKTFPKFYMMKKHLLKWDANFAHQIC